jgi:glyoxylase I family protein
MIKTDGVLHFTIPVKDLERSERFYRDVFGFEPIRRNDHMRFMRAGTDDYFVLTYSDKPIDPNPGDRHDIHHAFRVSPAEYERAKAFLRERGIPIIKEEDRKTGTFQGRSAYFHDPDRNVIELIDLRRVTTEGEPSS